MELGTRTVPKTGVDDVYQDLWSNDVMSREGPPGLEPGIRDLQSKAPHPFRVFPSADRVCEM
jgi:hypothetical protein